MVVFSLIVSTVLSASRALHSARSPEVERRVDSIPQQHDPSTKSLTFLEGSTAFIRDVPGLKFAATKMADDQSASATLDQPQRLPAGLP
jgi:hypothetical protein